MTVEIPDSGNLSAAPPRSRPEPEKLPVAAAGEGAQGAHNPFEDWLPKFASSALFDEAWGGPDQATPGQPKAKAGGAPAPNLAPAGPGSGKSADLIAKAKGFLGTPYKWGGTSPLGFDCSGFTQYIYRQFGIELPRVSYQQASAGKRIGINQLRPGDLVFWDTSSRNNGADHVAIYLGDGKVIHAPKPGDKVKISPLWDTGRAWGAAMNL